MSTSAKNSADRARRPRQLARAGSLLCLALAACAVGPDFKPPPPTAVDRYLADPQPRTAPAEGAQRFDAGAAVPADWWRLFRAPGLDRIVAEALAGNQTLAGAQASLRQSQFGLRAGYGVFLPQVEAGLSGSRERSSPRSFGSDSPGSVFNLFTISGTVGYALDVFGAKRRQVEALSANVDLASNVERATYLTLTANVVNTAIARAGYRAQIDATRAVIDAAAEQVRIAETQAAAGTAAYLSVLILKSQLAGAKASLAPLELRAEQAEHLLAVLAGRAPARPIAADPALDEFGLPDDLPLSLPSALVRQRPDILAAEASLHGASAQVGIATAAMLPSLTLSGSLGSDALTWQQLAKAGGKVWSAGANVSVPLFQGGELWYQRKAAIAAYEAALASYRQVVLSAFEQVADTLRAIEHDGGSVQAQSDSAAAAQSALRLAEVDYRAGLADYLTVLTALSQYQSARIALISARAQRLQDTVALYVALGGGWWNAQPAAVEGSRHAVVKRP